MTITAGAILFITLVAITLAIAWAVRWRRDKNRELQRLIHTVSDDALIDFIVPNGNGGEIHIDHLLLTGQGLILLDTKDMTGTVFAGDRMDTWSATHAGIRMTFSNPIPQLQDRAAAISLLVPNVPIDSRVLFINDATFPKGHPEQVSTVQALIDDYHRETEEHPTQDFSSAWQTIKAVAQTA
jgi:hypothetical protein